LEFDEKQLKDLIRHIRLVQEATQLMAERLIDMGEIGFGLTLIANGLKHDQSKFHGIEWDYLVRIDEKKKEDKEKAEEMLALAIFQHVTTNDHHPEYYHGGISEMPRECVAEMVCDWYARSTEQATDLRAWIKNEATEKYGFTTSGKVYKSIKFFVDVLLDPEFKPVKRKAPTKVPEKEEGEK
jgi:hypothetical protein